ncbi:hypothetical protein QL285_049702 [Trifolium repens]|nr:hypothetical protein QL285_049702 [Trifolium repens]
MVSERYPKDEDNYALYEDSTVDFVSAIDEDEDLSPDEDMEVYVPKVQSSRPCNHIRFGNFNQESNLEKVQMILINTVHPSIEGNSIKIGEIDCLFLVSKPMAEQQKLSFVQI